MEGEQKPIGNITAGFMIGVAVVFDLVQIILGLLGVGEIVDTLLTIVAYMLFWSWFKMNHQVDMFSYKNLTTTTSSAIAEAIPFINLLPTLTIAVSRTILKTRPDSVLGKLAEKTERTENALKTGKISSAPVRGSRTQKIASATGVEIPRAGSRQAKIARTLGRR